jgi:hypothetical protein
MAAQAVDLSSNMATSVPAPPLSHVAAPVADVHVLILTFFYFSEKSLSGVSSTHDKLFVECPIKNTPQRALCRVSVRRGGLSQNFIGDVRDARLYAN